MLDKATQWLVWMVTLHAYTLVITLSYSLITSLHWMMILSVMIILRMGCIYESMLMCMIWMPMEYMEEGIGALWHKVGIHLVRRWIIQSIMMALVDLIRSMDWYSIPPYLEVTSLANSWTGRIWFRIRWENVLWLVFSLQRLFGLFKMKKIKKIFSETENSQKWAVKK